ncbi:hypothetical protein AB0383_20205 [Amycolatopsis sp. NPDC051373]
MGVLKKIVQKIDEAADRKLAEFVERAGVDQKAAQPKAAAKDEKK